MTRLPRLRRLAAHPDVATLVWGLLLGVGICWPFFGGRPLFLLDWVGGPHQPLPSTAMLGLQGGLTAGVVGAVGMAVLVRTIGEAATWMVLLAVFPVAAVGIGRLTGGTRRARLAAATLYCVNPWVFNRIFAGHITLLFGYALLPFAVTCALRAPGRRSVRMLAPVLWWTVLTALSPHYAWIYGLVLVAAAAVTRPRTWTAAGRAVGWLVACAASFVVTSLYVLLPSTVTRLPTTVGSVDLRLYRTTGDPHLGLFPNVLGLYGFWRTGPGPQMAKDVVTGWPLLLVAILVVAAAGFWWTLRPREDTPASAGAAGAAGAAGEDAADSPGSRPTGAASDGAVGPFTADPDRRRLAWLLVVVGVAGYFLALGDQGPTGGLYRWAYDTVPFFAVMREAQKWLMLTALAYAAGFGWGIDRLARRRAPGPAGQHPRRRWRPAYSAVVVGLVLPLAYTPTIFDGLAGQIAPSTIPPAYAQANRLMGDGTGRVLYLPWHLYEAQPFTGGRVVATLGPTVFSRQVIAGDNLQLDGVQTQSTLQRSAYLQHLYRIGPGIGDFGAAVAPLGVKYVVLAKTVDWRSYRWLHDQRDLHLLADNQTLVVWRNAAYRGAGQRTGTRAPVRQVSPVAYRIPPGRPGTVTVDAAYQPGWELHGHPARPTAQGTLQFVVVGTAGGTARFTPWGLVKIGDLVSAAMLAALAVLVTWERWRTKRRRGATGGHNTSTTVLTS